VYGPGGYRFKDFIPIGLPLTVINMVVAIAMLYVETHICVSLLA
jgi:di/tricarboxylate transporter